MVRALMGAIKASDVHYIMNGLRFSIKYTTIYLIMFYNVDL